MRYFLELCLKSVETAIATMDAEIIVVDNNSEDGSCNMVKELFPNVVLIENKDNLGFSKGNNIGVSLARGEYLCILNPDTVVAEDTFLQLLSFSERQENLGIVGCKLINGIGDFLPESKRNVPYVKTSFKKILGNSQGYYSNHLNRKDIGKVDILVGAFMFMKKALYETIGGFDEDYFMYGEDIDLSYKVLKAGYHNYYYGATTIIHFKGESTLKDKYYARRFYGAMQIFYKKHFKKNVCFNVFVWSGIRLAYLARKVPISKPKKVSDYVFISDKVNKNLEAALSTKLILQKDLNNLENNSEVILDNTVLSYKEIISMIENNKKDRLITFKILPKNSNFILGSDNAISRGEVVVFE